MFTLPSPLMPFMPLSCLSPSHESHVVTHMCEKPCFSHLLHTSCTCHHQRLLTHVWAYCPLWMVKNPNPCGVYLASTSLTPHRSWEILALHLAFNPSRPLHLFSYKRRALSSFPNLPSTSLLCYWICEQPHPMSKEIIYTWWFHEVCIVIFWMVLCSFFLHVSYLHILRFA